MSAAFLFTVAEALKYMYSFPQPYTEQACAHTHTYMYTHTRTYTHTHNITQVISMTPDHDIWQRVRLSHHGGAIRTYLKPSSPQYGRSSPLFCQHCSQAREKCSLLGDLSLPDCPPLPKLDLLDEIDCCVESGYAQGMPVAKRQLSHAVHGVSTLN